VNHPSQKSKGLAIGAVVRTGGHMDTWVVCKVKGKMRDLTEDIARAYYAQNKEAK